MINVRTIKNWITRGGIQFVSITEELTRFRQRLESESDAPVHEIEVNAADLLSDLAVFLELGIQDHDTILGVPGVDYLVQLMDTRITPVTKH